MQVVTGLHQCVTQRFNLTMLSMNQVAQLRLSLLLEGEPGFKFNQACVIAHGWYPLGLMDEFGSA